MIITIITILRGLAHLYNNLMQRRDIVLTLIKYLLQKTAASPVLHKCRQYIHFHNAADIVMFALSFLIGSAVDLSPELVQIVFLKGFLKNTVIF